MNHMDKLIKNLIHFEEVDEVIKIRQNGQEENIVSKYVISKKIREHLLYMFKLLNSETHKSFNIIGNYGTGKSHFLAFIAALLEKQQTRQLVGDIEVKDVAMAFKRQFAVVKFECPAAQEVPLRKIFYENIQEQLDKKYGIDIDDIDLAQDYNNKKNVEKIIEQIKHENPELGLLVIVDEISDFLKQKSKTDMTYDLNFLREIGELSQEADFLYIGAMQEHVFTNPKYIGQAESIARIAERFVDINISKEDINRVISERIVKKDANQRLEIEDLLSGVKQYFTNLSLEMDKYIDLFPIHPYVIAVFEDLPYFENRGIIHFASKNVSNILMQKAPAFITYDRIYDMIDETHEIRNLEEISEVITVVKSLDSKVDLLDTRFRESARKIIKALAVLKMLAKTHMNGATVQELANTLLIVPPSTTIFDEDMAKDNIRRILHNLLKVTNGQFIDYDQSSDFYFINVDKKIDFDVLINNEIEKNQDKADWLTSYKKIMAINLDLKENQLFSKAIPYVYNDTAFWNSRRSYREGYLIIGTRNDVNSLPEQTEGRTRDYTVILHSPFDEQNIKQYSHKELIVGTSLSPELLQKLKRITATENLAKEGVYQKKFAEINKKETDEFIKNYLVELVGDGYAVFGDMKEKIKDLPPAKYNHLEDVLGHLKSHFYENRFVDEYPKYPKLKRDITNSNIESEVMKALNNLEKNSLFGLDSNTAAYLESFGAVRDGKLYSDQSEIMKMITDQVTEQSKNGKLTSLDEIIIDLTKKPYGIQREFVYLLIGCLLYNGEIVLVKNGGGRVYASDFSEQIKKGLVFFESINYIEQEKELPVAILIKLFDALGIQSGLIKDKESRSEAVKEVLTKADTLKKDMITIDNAFNQYCESLPEIPWIELKKLKEETNIVEQALKLLCEVKKVTDFGRLEIDLNWVEKLHTALIPFSQLKGLADDLSSIKSGLEYQSKAFATLENITSYIDNQITGELNRLRMDEQEILGNIKLLLKEDQRRPLKGKFEQFKEKYKKTYYHAHQKAVGDKVDWRTLEQITQSAKYQTLKQLKNLTFFSPAEFNGIGININTISQYKCISFNVDDLERAVVCSHCLFPSHTNNVGDINKMIESIPTDVENLWAKWERQLLSELKKLEPKIKLLSKLEYQKSIEDLLAQGVLPEVFPPGLLSALMEISSDLKQVDFNMPKFIEHLTQSASVLTVDQLDVLISEFTSGLLKGQDASKVRIRISDEK